MVQALIVAVIGIVLVVLAGLLPAPLSTIAWVVGIILAVVGLILLIVGLVRGSRSRL